MTTVFEDRFDAGRQLAERLLAYAGRPDAVVLAIPRGGLQAGFEVARVLRLPLLPLFSKKISFPGQPEVAVGAVSHGGAVSVDAETVARFNIPKSYIEDERKRLEQSIVERLKRFTGKPALPLLRNKLCILVDDGVATGQTYFAAVAFLRKQGVSRIVAAVPVGPPETLSRLADLVDELIVLESPPWMSAVGQAYQSFPQVEDEEAKRYLNVNVQLEKKSEVGKKKIVRKPS